MDNSIEQWLKQVKAAGLSDVQITNKLLEQGWSGDDISKLLHPKEKSSDRQNQDELIIQSKEEKTQKQKSNILKFYGGVAIVVMFGLIITWIFGNFISIVTFLLFAFVITLNQKKILERKGWL